ncbi:hypothetical protein KDA_52750 [Dictyobacter alpinus]|uniref:Iron permease FTR1 n=1 Tax=Dictyobacter alpinus TaxID=2014873 RepID=A0A402BED2_9CHLR|nr:FTR1 family protein [Dictyobacter alpinus]GCE29791.1 hypothetical protein KDA_52750 [Dictyobacter alpinus]
MKQEILHKASRATSGFAFGLLAFTSVGREGLETALFTVALSFQSSEFLTILGLVVAIALCYLIYRIGYRLNYRVFFRVMGILLIFFAAGLLSNSIGEFHELGWLPFGEQIVWNASHLLSQETEAGQLLHGLIGYADAPDMLQLGAYLAFLGVVGGFFLWMTRPTPPSPARTIEASSKAQPAR